MLVVVNRQLDSREEMKKKMDSVPDVVHITAYGEYTIFSDRFLTLQQVLDAVESHKFKSVA